MRISTIEDPFQNEKIIRVFGNVYITTPYQFPFPSCFVFLIHAAFREMSGRYVVILHNRLPTSKHPSCQSSLIRLSNDFDFFFLFLLSRRFFRFAVSKFFFLVPLENSIFKGHIGLVVILFMVDFWTIPLCHCKLFTLQCNPVDLVWVRVPPSKKNAKVLTGLICFPILFQLFPFVTMTKSCRMNCK